MSSKSSSLLKSKVEAQAAESSAAVKTAQHDFLMVIRLLDVAASLNHSPGFAK
jgi:hypothetical protein